MNKKECYEFSNGFDNKLGGKHLGYYLQGLRDKFLGNFNPPYEFNEIRDRFGFYGERASANREYLKGWADGGNETVN